MEQYEVNGLKLPSLLVELLQQGRWQHPGDEALKRVVPFLSEPVDFLATVESMKFESSGFLADIPEMAKVFHEARGSRNAEPVSLPWLDVDLAVFVAVNRFLGDDSGIALDFRTGATDPRVVASDWDDSLEGCTWREVSPSFSQFVDLLGV